MNDASGGRRPAASLDEMRRLMEAMPGPSLEAGSDAATRQAALMTTPRALGRLSELAQWMAGWQGRHPPDIRRPRLAIYAASHGISARLGAPDEAIGALQAQVHAMQAGGSPVNPACEMADAELRLYELDIANPSADLLDGPAMSEDACANAMAYGMMAPESGIDLLCLARLSPGGEFAAAALCTALLGGTAADWLDADDRTATTLAGEITAAASAWNGEGHDPLATLCRFGGFEMAAITGAIIAARMGGIPVLLDDFASCACAAILWRQDPRAIDHCLFAQAGAGGHHKRLLDVMGRVPLLDLSLREPGGLGCCLAIGLIRGALACHNGVMTRGELANVVNGARRL